MKIVLATDSFKECLSAAAVVDTLAEAVLALFPEAEVVKMPLADGGERTLEVLVKALDADIRETSVSDPLGRPLQAHYGVAGKTAIIEIAQACGLSLLAPAERNPLVASSRGVGELLMAAYKEGCRHFIVGLGGSATCDGGAGMMAVPGLKEMKDITVELLCDVDAPFVGPQGAARVFAPQKGASAQDVEVLENRMLNWADTIRQETGVNVANLPGAGAAGGLGGAFMAYWNARRERGIDRILELVGFEKALEGADLILTGEGKSDAQTLMGKVPMGVLQHAKGLPVALLSGRIENRDLLEQAGFSPIMEVTPRSLSLSEALQAETARHYLREACTKLL